MTYNLTTNRNVHWLKAAVTVVMLGTVSLANANNVAIWNSQLAIGNSNFAKAKIASLNASLKPKQQQLQSYKATVERLQQQLVSQQNTLTEAQKQELANQIQSNLQSFDQVTAQIQGELSAGEEDVLKRVSPVIKTITDNLIKQKNLDILLDSRDGNVTFVKPEWDLTQVVTQQLNEQVR